MVAHNKNFVPVPKPSASRNPRIAEPKDKVNPLHETDLICELADPSNSLEDLCASRGISLEALSLWMARPDVAQRLDLVQSTAMNRARFIGRLTLPTAAQSAANIINAHKLRPQKPTIDSAFDSDLHRANETMLKAARFLQRLTLEPAPRRAGNRVYKSETSSHQQGAANGAATSSDPTGSGIAQSKDEGTGQHHAQAATRAIESVDPGARTVAPGVRGKSRKSKRRPHLRSNNRSTKARTRTTALVPVQSRINPPSAPTPSKHASTAAQSLDTPPQNARAPEKPAAPPRAQAPASRAASG